MTSKITPPIERIQLLDNIEKEVINCLQSAGNYFDTVIPLIAMSCILNHIIYIKNVFYIIVSYTKKNAKYKNVYVYTKLTYDQDILYTAQDKLSWNWVKKNQA